MISLKRLLNEGPGEAKIIAGILDTALQGVDIKSMNGAWTIKTITQEALTDANFHREADKLDSLIQGAKYSGDPQGMQDVTKMLEDAGRQIAKVYQWRGYDIIDGIADYVKMRFGSDGAIIASRLKQLY